MTEKLALFGGSKTVTTDFEKYNSIGQEEIDAVTAVMKTGVLSKFLGCWDPDFFGGEQVQAFERQWEQYFGVKHAVTVNSNTSGLMAAVGAVGVEPGDEIIVSPWTMCASATAILIWNAIPVFADIEPENFNLDLKSIEKNITPRTKAIMVTDIFGHAAKLDEIMALAKKHNLKVIEDCAQAPGAMYNGKYVGTIADIGVFSLNYHKHIHTGEGGVCVTNNPELAERMQLIRNHAEAAVTGKGVTNLANMIGYNFRLTEIQAAIGIEQLKKLETLATERQTIAKKLSEGLTGLKGLKLPVVQKNCTHVYYMYPMLIDETVTGVSRAKIFEALTAEGIPNLAAGYQLIHQLPIYQKRIAFGSKGYPWTAEFYKGNVSYDYGVCPNAENLHSNQYLGIEMCVSKYSDSEILSVIKGFRKVWDNLSALR